MRHYRAEVDGLRAVAVLPVMLFHAGVELIPGGFLGVDVFFVISGYLISRILLDELERGTFSLLSFYERRARRILPALFVVMAVTFPLAYWLSPPDAFESYLGSLRATALFFSNIHFWQSIGYFNPAAEEQPLLHTWSLGVEEQFYILFPLLLWLVWRFARRYLLLIFSGLALFGFAFCLLQVSQSREAAFFLLHARAWELFAGVIVTILERKTDVSALRSTITAKALAVLGLILVIAGFFLVSGADDVPGWPTLWPVAGTFLILLFAKEHGPTGRVLAARPIVALGLISYGAYLWHHPLYAFARLYNINKPELPLMLALTLLAIGLAVLTYHLVEKPFRDRETISRQLVLLLAPLAILLVVTVGQWGIVRNWSETRIDQEQLAQVFPPLYKTASCAWREPDIDAPDIRFCAIGASGLIRPVVVWGDSHAQALIGEMDRALKQRGISGIYVDSTKCLRLPGVYTFNKRIQREARACLELQERAYKVVAELEPSAIIVHMRWTMRLFPLPGAGPSVGFANGEGGVEVEDERQLAALGSDGNWNKDVEAKTRAVNDFFSKLAGIAPVVLVGPVPEVGWHVGNRNFKSMIVRGETAPDITTSSAVFRSRNESALAILDTVAKQQRLRRVEPSTLFCDAMVPGRCVAQRAGISYYSDDDHLSQTGAAMLVEQIMKALPQT